MGKCLPPKLSLRWNRVDGGPTSGGDRTEEARSNSGFSQWFTSGAQGQLTQGEHSKRSLDNRCKSSRDKMRRRGRIPSGVARQRDIMMKRNTHEGEQECVASAQCEQGVKAQQEEPENSEHPGGSRKGRRGGNRNTIGVIFLPVPQQGLQNNTHSALPHTAVLTQR